MTWKFTDAKNRLSELFSRALTEGPQQICRGNDAVVVISADEYEQLVGNRLRFKEYLTQGPSFEGLDLTRD